MNPSDLAWLVTLILAVVAIVLTAVATATRQYWLATFGFLPVAGAIMLRALEFTPPQSPLFTLALTAALVAIGTAGGSPLVSLVMSRITRMPEPSDVNGGIPSGDRAIGKTASSMVLRGGATIGYLERFALIGSLLVGQPAAIALIVAIKGLGRFTELDSSAARERFIIGTLVSLVWASLCISAVVSW